MSHARARVGLLVALFSVASSAAAQDTWVMYPEPCRHGICSHGPHLMFSTHVLRTAASASAPALDTVPASEWLCVEDSFLRATLRTFTVTKPRPGYEVGETLTVLHYLSEGHYLLGDGDRVFNEQLDLQPGPDGRGLQCASDTSCWGVLDAPHQEEWWVFGYGDAGVRGWTHFGNGYSLRWLSEDERDETFIRTCNGGS